MTVAEFPGGLGSFITFVQVFFGVIIGLYFWNLFKGPAG